ncbi:MAG: hypothetical protein POELPBGB_02931 [Bacteroidia bacterium]|nr:hypothetical protein [Bacteroidia bacterium]
MTLKNFKYFITEVINEGTRLQNKEVSGHESKGGIFTSTRFWSFIISVATLWILPKGFSGDFAGYIISFLGIFIGLFSAIIISLFDKSATLLDEFSQKDIHEQTSIKKVKNHIVQFTGLTAYSILHALLLVGLLSFVLLDARVQTNIFQYHPLFTIEYIDTHSVFVFFGVTFIVIHRVLVVFYFLTFFVNTTYSITSYFSYLSSEYKKMKIDD